MKLEHLEEYGINAALRGMRNPMNSWSQSDSNLNGVGKKDLKLNRNLVKAGVEHRKHIRFITISLDITAPLYWWKQWDTYKVGTDSCSTSTMHKLLAKKFEIEDYDYCPRSKPFLEFEVQVLNSLREEYLETKDKEVWKAINKILSHSYVQKRTVKFNYEHVLKFIKERSNHKLEEWEQLLDFLKENLKYYYLLEEENENETDVFDKE